MGRSISIGGVHDLLESAAERAGVINESVDFSRVRVGLHDEIFQGNQPVLAGVDAASTNCYLLAGEAHRDGDTRAVHLFDAEQRGLDPVHTVADAGQDARIQTLVRDVRMLCQWLGRDVLVLAGPARSTRQELFDFVVAEMHRRESKAAPGIRPMRVALQNQRDTLPAFARVLDDKLSTNSQTADVDEDLVRQVCLLGRKPRTSAAYWQGWNPLRFMLTDKFHLVFEAVTRAMASTPRCNSLVENVNSRLRTYFTLRRHLGDSRLSLLQFFLNRRRFMRSRVERHDRSPRELMTAQAHPLWFALHGLGAPAPQRG